MIINDPHRGALRKTHRLTFKKIPLGILGIKLDNCGGHKQPVLTENGIEFNGWLTYSEVDGALD